jgi:hypothetical protein
MRLSLILAVLVFAGAAHAAELTATPATLPAVLAKAHGGDHLTLTGPGGDVALRKLSFSPSVTISAAGATLRTLTLIGDAGLHFDGLSVAYTPDAKTVDWSAAVLIDTSADIVLNGATIIGRPAVAGGLESDTFRAANDCVIGRPCGYGVNIQHSRGITIANSEVSQFDHGLTFNDLTSGVISANDIHDNRRTPLVGAEPHGVVIDGNHLHDSHPWRFAQTPLGDHGDLAAFWSNAAQVTPSDGLTFTHNRLDQMAGSAVLGMWLQGTPAAPFTDFNISGNIFLIANLQAVMLKYSQGGHISGNTMITAVVAGIDPKQRPTILLNAGVSNVSVIGNKTSAPISDASGGKNPQSDNNLLAGQVSG